MIKLLNKIAHFLHLQEKPITLDYIKVGGVKIYPQDVQLIKTVKLAMNKNIPVIIHPPKLSQDNKGTFNLGELLEALRHDTIAEEINYMSYQNAVERKAVEGWDAEKTLIETGYYVPD